MSPLQRSKAKLEGEGWHVSIVEHWNSFARIRQDLWGFADLLCLKEREVMAVQVTSRTNVSARMKKIAESPLVDIVRKAEISILVHGWDNPKRGEWRLRVEDVS